MMDSDLDSSASGEVTTKEPMMERGRVDGTPAHGDTGDQQNQDSSEHSNAPMNKTSNVQVQFDPDGQRGNEDPDEPGHYEPMERGRVDGTSAQGEAGDQQNQDSSEHSKAPMNKTSNIQVQFDPDGQRGNEDPDEPGHYEPMKRGRVDGTSAQGEAGDHQNQDSSEHSNAPMNTTSKVQVQVDPGGQGVDRDPDEPEYFDSFLEGRKVVSSSVQGEPGDQQNKDSSETSEFPTNPTSSTQVQLEPGIQGGNDNPDDPRQYGVTYGEETFSVLGNSVNQCNRSSNIQVQFELGGKADNEDRDKPGQYGDKITSGSGDSVSHFDLPRVGQTGLPVETNQSQGTGNLGNMAPWKDTYNTPCAPYSQNQTVVGDIEDLYRKDPSRLLTKVKSVVKIYSCRAQLLQPSRIRSFSRQFHCAQYMELKSLVNKLAMYNEFLENVAIGDSMYGEEFGGLLIQLDAIILECDMIVEDYRNLGILEEDPSLFLDLLSHSEPVSSVRNLRCVHLQGLNTASHSNWYTSESVNWRNADNQDIHEKKRSKPQSSATGLADSSKYETCSTRHSSNNLSSTFLGSSARTDGSEQHQPEWMDTNVLTLQPRMLKTLSREFPSVIGKPVSMVSTLSACPTDHHGLPASHSCPYIVSLSVKAASTSARLTTKASFNAACNEGYKDHNDTMEVSAVREMDKTKSISTITSDCQDVKTAAVDMKTALSAEYHSVQVQPSTVYQASGKLASQLFDLKLFPMPRLLIQLIILSKQKELCRVAYCLEQLSRSLSPVKQCSMQPPPPEPPPQLRFLMWTLLITTYGHYSPSGF